MGIPINGITKPDAKKTGVNGIVNGNGKRKSENSSDSEDDSKSRLITKLSTRKTDIVESPSKKKRFTETVQHKALINATVSATSSPTPIKTLPEPPNPSKSQDPPVDVANSPPLSDPTAILKISPTKHPLITELPKFSEISATAEAVTESNESKEREKRRLKNKLKKEKKKLRNRKNKDPDHDTGI
jgi:hypothetical protein